MGWERVGVEDGLGEGRVGVEDGVGEGRGGGWVERVTVRDA